MLGAAGVILLFYLVAAAALLVLGAFFCVGVVVVLAAARFGLAGVVGRHIAVPPARIIGILARNLWLPSSPEYRVTLQPDDAPGLFDAVRDLAGRLAVQPPRTTYVEMNDNASVTLSGLRRGSGRTTLGVGFDLLAGLNVTDVSAVLAHEMAHAKLVRRGLDHWLKRGMTRLARVASELSECAASYREMKEPSDLANEAESIFKPLAKRAARFVATYSRQDEFEADRLAAELCGTAAVGSALTKLDRLSDALAWLPWSERLARVQPGERFSDWLVRELTRATASETPLPAHAVDPYSTHPSMRDRIAALPPGSASAADTRPGTALLADPDGVAGRLIAEIRRVVLKQEERHSRQSAREARKWSKRRRTGVGPVLSLVAVVAGVMLGIVGLVDGFTPDLLAWMIGSLVFGIVVGRVTSPRIRRELPVPAYGRLRGERSWDTQEELAAQEQTIVAELRSATADKTKHQRMEVLLAQSRDALARREFLRAHVASRLALEIHAKSVDAALSLAVAAAALGLVQQTQRLLAFVRARAGVTTVTAKWGAAWAMTLIGDWSAEGLLLQLRHLRPQVATFPALLAHVQDQRGKVQSGIRNAEAALELEPDNRVIAQLLAHLLLVDGDVANAARRLEPLAETARTEIAAAFLMLRAALLRGEAGSIAEWAGVVRALDEDGEHRLGLGHALASARLDEDATVAFGEALAAGFSPEANLGLASIASFRGDRAEARSRLLAALRLDGAKISEHQTPNALFHDILAKLNMLDEGRLQCRAWTATFPADHPQLGECSLLVCATSESSARKHLETIVTAMNGSDAPCDMSRVRWRAAPAEQQPERPVQPGVWGLVA